MLTIFLLLSDIVEHPSESDKGISEGKLLFVYLRGRYNGIFPHTKSLCFRLHRSGQYLEKSWNFSLTKGEDLCNSSLLVATFTGNPQ